MRRAAEPLQQVDRTYVISGGRKLSYFGGCDYFRLSSHPRILAALESGLREWGLNVAASRTTTGNHRLYLDLEEALCEFFEADCAVLVSSGYFSNLATAQALRGSVDHVFIDERGHGSLQDAARLLETGIRPFPRAMPEVLDEWIRALPDGAAPAVLTEGVFGQDGSLSPLPALVRRLGAKGLLLVDDAHAAGILGARGRGTLEHFGLERKQVIQTVTLSKAFGVYGGAILCGREIGERIVARSGIYVGNTPLPLPLAAAALESLRLVREDASLKERLDRNTAEVKTALKAAGVPGTDGPAPVLAYPISDETSAERMKQRLLSAGIYSTWVRYPGGPSGSYFRFAWSSEHSPEQLGGLVRALAEWHEAEG